MFHFVMKAHCRTFVFLSVSGPASGPQLLSFDSGHGNDVLRTSSGCIAGCLQGIEELIFGIVSFWFRDALDHQPPWSLLDFHEIVQYSQGVIRLQMHSISVPKSQPKASRRQNIAYMLQNLFLDGSHRCLSWSLKEQWREFRFSFQHIVFHFHFHRYGTIPQRLLHLFLRRVGHQARTKSAQSRGMPIPSVG